MEFEAIDGPLVVTIVLISCRKLCRWVVLFELLKLEKDKPLLGGKSSVDTIEKRTSSRKNNKEEYNNYSAMIQTEQLVLKRLEAC